MWGSMRVMHDTRVAATAAALDQLVANAVSQPRTPTSEATSNATTAVQGTGHQDGPGTVAEPAENPASRNRSLNATMFFWNRRA